MTSDRIPVRQPVRLRATRRRNLIHRLALRFPGLVPRLSRALFRLPPHSAIRRGALRYLMRTAVEGANRGDYEAVFSALSADYEVITPPELVGLGFERTYRGREGRMQFQQRWIEQLEDFQQDEVELLDYGDQLLLLARMSASGLSSGAAFDSEIAYLLTIVDGEIAREHSYRSHEEGLRAAERRSV